MSREEVESGLQRRIAEHHVEFLEENPDACGWLSIHVGHHPYVRHADGEWQMAENMGYGSVEVDIVDRETVVGYFERDPVDITPVEEHDIWEQVELGDGVEVYR